MRNEVTGTIACVVLLLSLSSLATAQTKPTTVEEFQRAGAADQRSTLVDIITRRSGLSPDSMVEILKAALEGSDPVVRLGALAAVVSRASAPMLSRTDAVLADWNQDRPRLNTLQTQIVRALGDPVPRVRQEAIRALVSLDYRPENPAGALAPETERLLIERFYAEPDAGNRARIVAGFASQPGTSSVVLGLFANAFGDPDHRVRHAATLGATRLDVNLALTLLIRQLGDSNADVRVQTAIIVSSFGPQAAPYLDALRTQLEREEDARVADALQKVILSVSTSAR